MGGTDVATDADATLATTTIPPGHRAARDDQARANLIAWGAADLIDMLGLGDEPPTDAGPLDHTCPVCTARPGDRCHSVRGAESSATHRSRLRLAGRGRP